MFRVGDVITGVRGNGYAITNDVCKCIVSKMYDDDRMIVVILESEDSMYVKEHYTVENSDTRFRVIEHLDEIPEEFLLLKKDDFVLYSEHNGMFVVYEVLENRWYGIKNLHDGKKYNESRRNLIKIND